MKRSATIVSSLLLLLVLTAGTVAHAQHGAVSGTVKAGDTGEPLPGANVKVMETSIGTSTNISGKFEIADVPTGTHTLQISFVGYETAQRQVTVNEGGSATVNVVLPVSSETFNEVVVTGSKKKESLVDAPVQMEVLNPEEMATSGGDTFLSSLSNLKGVDFTRTGINRQSISMRGFDSHYNSRLLQLKDGYIMKAPGNGLPMMNYMSTSQLDVKRMEVVIGPASALYGPNAHSGVLNVITKTPWDESGVAVDVRGGQQNLIDLNARAAGTVGEDFGWKITGQYMSANDYRPKIKGPGASDSTHFFGTRFHESEVVENYDVGALRGEGSLYYRFGEDWQLEGTYGFSQNNNFDALTSGRIRLKGLRFQHQNLRLSNDRWQFQVTRTSSDEGESYLIDGVSRSADAMYSQMVQNGTPANEARQQVLSQLPALRDSSGYQLNGKLWDAGVQYQNTYYIGSGSIDLVTGAQYRKYAPSSEKTFLADAIGRDISMSIGGAFVQTDYRPTDALRINAAARVDHMTNFGTLVSPKASFMYTVASDHTFRFTYNRAFKSPTVIKQHLYAGPARGNTDGFTVRSGPSEDAEVVRRIDPLRPEEVNSVEVGYNGIYQNRLFVSLVAYNSWYSDFISPGVIVASPFPSINPSASQPTFGFDDGELVGGSGVLATYYNFGEAVVRGIDLGVEYALPEKLSASGSVSYITIADAQRGNATQPLLLNVPNLKVKGGVTVRDVGLDNFFVSLDARWKEAFKFRAGFWNSENYYEDGKIPSRFTANLTAGYSVPETGLKIKASATNLFNTQVPEQLGAPQVGRLLWLSATYNFSSLGL